MRALISELGRDPLAGGLVPALARHVAGLCEQDAVVDVARRRRRARPLAEREAHLFGIGREALANAVKHSGATDALGADRGPPGRGRRRGRRRRPRLRPGRGAPGPLRARSMRSRAAEIGGRLTIASAPGQGTVVRARRRRDGLR